MFLRNQLRDRQTLMSIGMLALILGNISHYFFHPGAAFSQNFVDAFTGLWFGISIGCNLLSLGRPDRVDFADPRSTHL